MLYSSPWAGVEPKTSMVMGTEYIDSCKSKYHMTTTTIILEHAIFTQCDKVYKYRFQLVSESTFCNHCLSYIIYVFLERNIA
jgi:hypothetical protein